MARIINKLAVQNYRCLASLDIELGHLNVFFGPNGAGKTTLMDSVWFVRDCLRNGVSSASSERGHGIGMLYDKAPEGAQISIGIDESDSKYVVSFGFSGGRIEPYAGETLTSKDPARLLIDRQVGIDYAKCFHFKLNQAVSVPLRDPEQLALASYIFFQDESREESGIEKLLRFMHKYSSRDLGLYKLKTYGSESSYQTFLWDRCENLFSVLRNLHDKRGQDVRFDTIVGYMREAFPSFRDIFLEQTGINSVYANFVEKNLSKPIAASGASDGYLQLLILLTGLFSEGEFRPSIILFDEPETSLHPWAIKVFGDAVKEATASWNKQVFVATHSPVLVSQFNHSDVFTVERGDSGQSIATRVDKIESLQEQLECYATGSLYEAGVLAPQSGANGGNSIPVE